MRKWRDTPLSIVVLICGVGLGIVFCCSDGGVEVGIVLISVSVGIFLASLIWYLYKNNFSLYPKLQPVYKKICDTVSPYRNLDVIIKTENSAKSLLRNITKEYKDGLKRKCLRDDDICKIIIETENQVTKDAFAYMFIVYYLRYDYHNRFLSQEEETQAAVLSLERYCEKKIANRINDIPDLFWTYFELNKVVYENKT